LAGSPRDPSLVTDFGSCGAIFVFFPAWFAGFRLVADGPIESRLVIALMSFFIGGTQ